LTKEDIELEDEEDLPVKHNPDASEDDEDMQYNESNEKVVDSSENVAGDELPDSGAVSSEKSPKEEVVRIPGDENASREPLVTEPSEPESMETEPKPESEKPKVEEEVTAELANPKAMVDPAAKKLESTGSEHTASESIQQVGEVIKEPAELRPLNPKAEEAEPEESKVTAGESAQQGAGEEVQMEPVNAAGELSFEPIVLPPWTQRENGDIPCPPKMRGGCGCHTLRLKSLFEHNWVSQLIKEVEEQLKDYKEPEKEDSVCSDCASVANNTSTRLAAHRADSRENYLYCPTLQETQKEGLAHFQKHWSHGQPVIVRNVMEGASGLSWEPLTMWRALRETTRGKFRDDSKTVRAIDCSDWSEARPKLFLCIKY